MSLELYQLNIKAAEHGASTFIFKRRVPHFIHNEVRQAALIGLWKASLAFNPSRGFKFKTLMWAYINGYMRNELRQQRKLNGFYTNRRRVCKAMPVREEDRMTNEDGLSAVMSKELKEEAYKTADRKLVMTVESIASGEAAKCAWKDYGTSRQLMDYRIKMLGRRLIEQEQREERKWRLRKKTASYA